MRIVDLRLFPIVSLFFFTAVPSHAQLSSSSQCGEQANAFQGLFNNMKTEGAKPDPQAGLEMMTSLMGQIGASMGSKNPGAEAMFGLFQNIVSSMSSLTDCRRTQVNTAHSY